MRIKTIIVFTGFLSILFNDFFYNSDMCYKIVPSESIFTYEHKQDSSQIFDKKIEALFFKPIYYLINNDFAFINRAQKSYLIDIEENNLFITDKGDENSFYKNSQTGMTNPYYGQHCSWRITKNEVHINGHACMEIITDSIGYQSKRLKFYVSKTIPNINIHSFSKPLPGLIIKEQRWIYDHSFDSELNITTDSALININYIPKKVNCPDIFIDNIDIVKSDFLHYRRFEKSSTFDEKFTPDFVNSINKACLGDTHFESVVNNIFEIPTFNGKVEKLRFYQNDKLNLIFERKENYDKVITFNRYRENYDTIKFFNSSDEILRIESTDDLYALSNDTIVDMSTAVIRKFYFDKDRLKYYEFSGQDKERPGMLIYNSSMNLVEIHFQYSGGSANFIYDEKGNIIEGSSSKGKKRAYRYNKNGLLNRAFKQH